METAVLDPGATPLPTIANASETRETKESPRPKNPKLRENQTTWKPDSSSSPQNPSLTGKAPPFPIRKSHRSIAYLSFLSPSAHAPKRIKRASASAHVLENDPSPLVVRAPGQSLSVTV